MLSPIQVNILNKILYEKTVIIMTNSFPSLFHLEKKLLRVLFAMKCCTSSSKSHVLDEEGVEHLFLFYVFLCPSFILVFLT